MTVTQRMVKAGYKQIAPGVYVRPLPPKSERVKRAIIVGKKIMRETSNTAVRRSWQTYIAREAHVR